MPDTDPVPILTALIELAQTQLSASWAEAHDQNTYSLGLAGLGVATMGIIAAAQTSLGSHWWIPMPGLAAATILALLSTRLDSTNLGPDPTGFFGTFGDNPAKDALAHLLADLTETQRELPRLLRNQRRSLIGVALLLAATAIYSTLALV